MAINPNTNFTTGAVYTADQANRFPRGVMAYTETDILVGSVSAEIVSITGSSFTAVANRYYKVTYFEPGVYSVTSTTYFGLRLRLTNISGTQKQIGYTQFVTTGSNHMSTISWVGTLPAGTTNFVGTAFSQTGTCGLNRSTPNTLAYLLVEDIGPA